MDDLQSLLLIRSPLVMIVGALVVLMVGLWVKNRKILTGLSLAALLLSGYFAFHNYHHESPAALFGGLLAFDALGSFVAFLSILVLALVFVISYSSSEIKDDRYGDYLAIMLALGSGLVFMATATNLLMIYLSIETVSILSFTLAGFHKEKNTSSEAALKYVVFGSMASGIMIFGMSLIFGITGGIDINAINEFLLRSNEFSILLWLGTLMVFAGFGYKISAAPMHMWTPDVYEGAPTPVTTMFSVAPKAAGMALLMRFFVGAFSSELSGAELGLLGSLPWTEFIMISSIATMFAGNLAALQQNSVKRLLAYSAIAHAGYMMMGLTTGTLASLPAIVFYLIIYCLMNIGAFWVCSKTEETLGGEQLKHFKGLIHSKPFYAVCMTIFMGSLIGLPPFVGFIGKMQLFSHVISKNMYTFVILAGVNSVISLYYYWKVVKAMILEKAEIDMPAGPTAFDSWPSRALIGLLALLNISLGLGIYLDKLIELSKEFSEML